MPRPSSQLLVLVSMLLATSAATTQRYTPPAADLDPLPLRASCAPDANAEVDRGAALLVVLASDEARRAFERAAVLDPDCALGYWGQAVSYLPSASQPLTMSMLEAGAGAARRAASVPARTVIERGLVESIALLVTPGGVSPIGARLDAYETRLRQLALAHSDIAALAILHARAMLLRTTLPGDAARTRARQAIETAFASRALPAGAAVVLLEAGEGAASPDLAARAADAVARVRLPQPHHLALRALVSAGAWERAGREGDLAVSYAGSTASPALLYGSRHDFAPEWLVEAHLQRGRRQAARTLLARLTRDLDAASLDPDVDAAVRRGATRAVARITLDERSSAVGAPPAQDMPRDEAWPWRFAQSAVTAWHAWPGGDAARLRDAASGMAAIDASPATGAVPDRERELARTLIEAIAAASQDEHPQAQLLLMHAAQLEARLLEAGSISLPLMPARELAGEIWQRFYRYPDAERDARAALERFPNRWRALITLAQAAAALKRPDDSRALYQKLDALRADADANDPAREEARRALR
jgi:hypothetical protein